MKKLLIVLILAAIAVVLAMTYRYQGLLTQKEEAREEAPVPEEEPDILPAKDDYSGFAGCTMDAEGVLHVPDNQTVEAPSSTKIRTRFLYFEIPEAWRERLTIQTDYMKQGDDSEIYEDPVKDSFYIRFYERDTYNRYHSSHYAGTPGIEDKGLLTELVAVNTEKDPKIGANDAEYLYAGDLMKDDTRYQVYLNQIIRTDERIEKEFASTYEFLRDLSYIPCLLAHLDATDGTFRLANSYLKTRYIDQYDASAAGMTSDAKVPNDYAHQKETGSVLYPLDETVPEDLEEPYVEAYAWDLFTSPWLYPDIDDVLPENTTDQLTDTAQTEAGNTALPTEAPVDEGVESSALPENGQSLYIDDYYSETEGATEDAANEITADEDTEATENVPEETLPVEDAFEEYSTGTEEDW